MRKLTKVVADVELYAVECAGKHVCPTSIKYTDEAAGLYIMPSGVSSAEFKARIDGAGAQSMAFDLDYYHVKVGNSIYCYKLVQDKAGCWWSRLQ